MSQANTLPDSQTAFDNLMGGVAQRVFFAKCAAAGIAPRNQEDAEWMLKTAGKLRLIEQHAQVKQAQDAGNPFARADRALDQVMASYGINPGYAQGYQEQEVAIKQAAYDAMQDPTIYNSVLAMRAAEAEQIRTQLAAA